MREQARCCGPGMKGHLNLSPLMNRRHFIQSSALLWASGLASCRLPATLPVAGTKGRAGRGNKPAAAPAASPVVSLPPGVKVTYVSCKVPGQEISMTFDDGPHPELTPRLLDMLQDWGLKASFFLIGRNARAFPKIVQRIIAEGHEVGNHSWTHPVLAKLGDVKVRTELKSTHEAIVQACGVAPRIFRPPYGAITAKQKQWIAAEFGYSTILWSVDTNDWKDRNAQIVSGRILNEARPGSIILAHDIHPTSVEAMPLALPALRDKGMKFQTVSGLISLEAGARPATAVATTPPAAAETLLTYSPGTF